MAKAKKSTATILVELASRHDLWHTSDHRSFATMRVDGHLESWRIRSSPFKRWLAREFFGIKGSSANSQAVNDALQTLEGIAMFDGKQYPIFTRIAGDTSRVYLDLCNPCFEVVEVDADGWRILSESPVKFRRAAAMLPLPRPENGSSLKDLSKFVNTTDNELLALMSYLIGAVHPSGPFPILGLFGEQGNGKSTTAKVLRSLVDPNKSPLRCEPREPRDLMIAASNGWLIALDNLSYVQPWLSDALCRLSTGGGFATRMLFADDEEVIFEACRPILLTGIEDIATRSDLLDRSILVQLPSIPDEHRMVESEFWFQFDLQHAALLGGLLDCISTAIRNFHSTRPKHLPRMADFGHWLAAAAPAVGETSESILACYSDNRSEANSLALESSIIAKPLWELLEARTDGPWSGTAGELLEELNRIVDETTGKLKQWPKTARSLSGQLKRLIPNLRRAGVEVENWRDTDAKRRRMIALRKAPQEEIGPEPSEPSAPSEALENNRCGSDGRRTVRTVGRTV